MDVADVYKKIEDSDVQIFSFGISGIKGLTICATGNYGLFINDKEIENSEEEFMVASHEYGHCMTGTTYAFDTDEIVKRKCEYKADRFAVFEFLPIEKFKEAINCGCQMPYEFAEYLDLPEKFVVMAFKHYSDMGLI